MRMSASIWKDMFSGNVLKTPPTITSYFLLSSTVIVSPIKSFSPKYFFARFSLKKMNHLNYVLNLIILEIFIELNIVSNEQVGSHTTGHYYAHAQNINNYVDF